MQTDHFHMTPTGSHRHRNERNKASRCSTPSILTFLKRSTPVGDRHPSVLFSEAGGVYRGPEPTQSLQRTPQTPQPLCLRAGGRRGAARSGIISPARAGLAGRGGSTASGAGRHHRRSSFTCPVWAHRRRAGHLARAGFGFSAPPTPPDGLKKPASCRPGARIGSGQ